MKTMKKNYLEPVTELIELETLGFLAGSEVTGDIPGGDDGGVGGSDKEASDTSTPGWSEGF